MIERFASFEPTQLHQQFLTPHMVDIDGVSCQYRETGKGTNILALHGWIGSSTIAFENLGVELAQQGNRFIALGLPGFGESDPLPSKQNLVNQISSVASKFSDQVCVGEDATVVGTSLGTRAAIELAARRPDKVRHLVLQSPIIHKEDIMQAARITKDIFTHKYVAPLLMKLGIGQAFMSSVFRNNQDFLHTAKEVQDMILKSLNETDPFTAIQTLREIDEDMEEHIAQIQCPVLIVHGDRDGLVSLNRIKRTAAIFKKYIHPDAVMVDIVPGHGHNVPSTAPKRMAQSIVAFKQAFA